METNKENCKKSELKSYLDKVPHGNYRHIRRRIIEECHISAQTFTNYVNGYTDVPPLVREKMNKIAIEETGVSAFDKNEDVEGEH